MGYAIAMGACFACGKIIGFNPNKVPSYQNNPICRECIERINPQRIKNGLEPVVIAPDAYEPIEEGELR